MMAVRFMRTRSCWPRTTGTNGQWRSRTLSISSLSIILTIELGFIIAIAVLLYLSNKNQGFIRVTGRDSSFSAEDPQIDSIWGQGLLWTAFPTLTFTLYRLYWDSVVSAHQEEAPYAELAKVDGCRISRSILLDYRSFSSLSSWYIAFRNGHWHLGISMILSFVVSLVLVPLSARIFATQFVGLERPIGMEITTVFDQQSLNSSVDYRPILDTAAAVRVYGGYPPAWTDGEYSFPTFDISPTEGSVSNITNISVNVTAQSAYLNCRTLTDYSVSRVDSPDGATLVFTAVDDGCNITLRGGLANGTAIYLKPVTNPYCSEAAGYSRLSFFAGYYDASLPYLLRNLSIISCTPTYHQSHGLLSKSNLLIPGFPALAFTPDTTNTSSTRPLHWINFETSLQDLSNFDPAQPDFSTAYGDLLLTYAKKVNPTSPISPESLASAASTIFSTIYAFLGATEVFQPLTPPSLTIGSVTHSENRLHVIPWIGYTCIGILFVLATQTVLIVFFLQRHKTILREDPVGLMGMANLLYRSDVHELVHQAREEPGFDGRFLDFLETKYDVQGAECRVLGDTAAAQRIAFTKWEKKRS